MKTPFSIQLPWPSMHLWHSRSPITLHSHILVSCTPLWCYWPGLHQTCWKPSDPHKFILVVTDQSVFCTSSGFFYYPSAKLNLAVLWVMAFLRLTLSSVRRGARHPQIFFSPNQKHLLVFFPNRRFVWGHQLHLPLLVTRLFLHSHSHCLFFTTLSYVALDITQEESVCSQVFFYNLVQAIILN